MIEFNVHLIAQTALVEFKRFLAQNQFASGGLLMVVLGAVFAYARALPAQVYNWLWSRLVLTVEITSEDRAFEWFRVWLSEHPSNTRARHFGLSTRAKDERGGFKLGEDSDEDAPKAVLSPIDGTLLVRFQGRRFWFSSSREKIQKDGSVRIGMFETLSIRTFFTNRGALSGLVAEAYRSTVNPFERRVEIMAPRWDSWRTLSRVVPRDPDSLAYKDGLFERVLEDARRFLQSEHWYANMGIPWRRGYLLHGPPGNGKSSLITALAGELGKSVCVLNLASGLLTDDGLVNLLSDAPDGALVLLEDIDAIFQGRKRDEAAQSKLSFNGLLNALDGVTAQQGRMVFMTTNHLERLDPALVRPGRADVHLFVGNASQLQVARMLERFFPELDANERKLMASQVPEERLSMAHIQELLVRFRDDLAGLREAWALELVDAQPEPRS